MKYLLDTNACIDFIRNTGKMRGRMKARPFSDFCISTVVVAELIHGAKRSAKPEKHLSAAKNFCGKLKCVSFDLEAADVYGDVRLYLEKEGQLIGAYDMLIAAHAKSMGLICITNDKGFCRVNGLTVEDWR